MKKLIVSLTLLCFVISASLAQQQTPDPIRDAQEDAIIDGGSYKARGWGFIAFAASSVLSPLFGGGTVITLAYVLNPPGEVPTVRLAEAQKVYDDSGDVLIYQAQYRESIAEPIKKTRARRSWQGTWLGVAVNVLVIFAIAGTLAF